jgi:hypothetical protein
MPRAQGRNLDQIDVIEGGIHGTWLIDLNTVPGGVKNNAAMLAKLQALTLRDLYRLVGFRGGASPNNTPQLTFEDIDGLGKCFAAQNTMAYQGEIFSCCCCADAEG